MNNESRAVIASNRFGFGARPGDLGRISGDPDAWLLRQIEQPEPLGSGVSNSQSALAGFIEFRKQKRTDRAGAGDKPDSVADIKNLAGAMRPVYMEHVMARTAQLVNTSTPFYERLVHFWSNHFAVSADNPQMTGLAGTLETEAIRPHVNGRFTDMLIAVEKHPAMLTYLDNFQSIGPNSLLARHAGKRKRKRKFDINENLAREILELHTLGVDSVYTQKDVSTFAKVISGWTYGGLFDRRINIGETGKFVFNHYMHEPGTKKVLNKAYPDSGLGQGEAVLKDLALHPHTARHLATKLARHFIEDEPSEYHIDTLAQTYLQSRGFLPAVYERLITFGEIWQTPFAKYKTPADYLYSIFRSISYVPEQARQIIAPLTVLGQAPFKPGSPAGWPDTAKQWSGGEALFKRLEFAISVANKIGNRVNPAALAGLITGPLLSEQSKTAISRADSAAQGLALFFSSPEFLRR